ncbi:MAG TPA: bifunctional (p)ppGpp synthetase/guanosine-3',5'-bis(diphosphate) 3'-pyrophosphohydrolase [Steroidobacteraceae bacterium]|nr:bifunctional (p)ppGpp synthetase/guanosine-3',5'-bis(diphosphate) 3'-pyrophosphohydrolase [Steroidobacteraceae bacterium]
MESTHRTELSLPAVLEPTRALLAELGGPSALLDQGAEAAAQVFELTDDVELASAVWLDVARQLGLAASDTTVTRRLSAPTAALAAELSRLGEIGLAVDWSADQGLNPHQAETLRQMLLAVVSDPRMVIARLAEQVVWMRHARDLPPAQQRRRALETREIYAPLANRLGIWNLKWELEDLGFRYLQPDDYRRIASALSERRVDRERYIRDVCALLDAEFQRAGIKAEIQGRAKHIYSIWRKMQRKHIAFEQLYDVRAFRIVVDSIADCYAALGLVHGLWAMLPEEFDDYIATPKDNQYRSIHTALTGPEGKALEIQIRTRDMHEHAELGVAAHWRYKEGGARDQNYERKIEWVRKLLDPSQGGGEDADFIERVRAGLFSDRVYALTPRGEVIDLPRGATPLDYAYHVHTDLGHRCRGGKVNGRIVPLNQPLHNGDVVEIITGRAGGPSRDWLNPESGFLASSRSRSKVRAWFRQQELAAAAEPAKDASTPAAGVTAAAAPPLDTITLARPRKKPQVRHSPVIIEGVGDLPITMARCCGPVPPTPIACYLTIERGVTVHRADCPSLARMRALKPERVLRVTWNQGDGAELPVQVRVEAYDRRGLLRDVSDAMALEHLSIDGVNSNTDPSDGIATIVMRTAVHDMAELQRVLKRLKGVANVLKAERAG